MRAGLGQHDMAAISEVGPVISLLWTDVTLLTDQPFFLALLHDLVETTSDMCACHWI